MAASLPGAAMVAGHSRIIRRELARITAGSRDGENSYLPRSQVPRSASQAEGWVGRAAQGIATHRDQNVSSLVKGR